MTGRCAISLVLWGVLIGTPPAFAHKDRKKACEATLMSEEAQGQLLIRFERLEQNLHEILRAYQQLPYAFMSEFQLAQKIELHVDGYRDQMDEALATWEPTSAQSSHETERLLTALEYKIARLKEENRLWQDRYFVSQKTDLAEVRGDRMMILPNRIYEVQSDRGERVRVRFSRDLVEEFFWQSAGDTSADAADRALEAIARGFRPSTTRAATGICVLPAAIGGESIYVLKFSGRAVGAHRVYGLIQNGIIGFVTHEAESEHDCKYLRRAADRAIKAHQAQKW